MMLPWVVAWCGIGVLYLSQLPSPPPGLSYRFGDQQQTVYQSISIKLTFDVLGENPLYADIDWYTVLTSLPSPACRRSCGLVLALATTSGQFRVSHRWRGCRDDVTGDDTTGDAIRSATNHRRVLSVTSASAASGLAHSLACIMGRLDRGKF